MVSIIANRFKKIAYSNKCRVILPFITKFVACWERSERKKIRYVWA